MVSSRVIKWDLQAREELKRIVAYIRKDSEQNAQKVKNEIVDIIKSLPRHPLRFPPDKFKDDNDGSYRAFIKHKYRVAYKVEVSAILILRIRSDKQEPLPY